MKATLVGHLLRASTQCAGAHLIASFRVGLCVEKGPIHSSAILEFEMTFAIHAKEAGSEFPRGSSERLLSRFQTDLLRGTACLCPCALISDINASAKEIASRILQTEHLFFAHARRDSYRHSSETGLIRSWSPQKRKMDGAANLLAIKTQILKKITSE